MDYRLENIDNTTFENLINTICQKILGTGVVVFSEGKDGGRDGKFDGFAQNYPSETDSWSGKFIIQAKHTSNPIASCSDNNFEKIVDEEIKKIKELNDNNEVDNYLLFTNRKYSAITGERLTNKIKHETGVENSVIIGKEVINNQYLNSNKEIVKQYQLDLNHIPFDFSDDEIKDIILVFKKQLPEIKKDVKRKVDQLKYDYSHIDKDKKIKRII